MVKKKSKKRIPGVIQEKKRHLQSNGRCELQQTSYWELCKPEDNGWQFSRILGGDEGRG